MTDLNAHDHAAIAANIIADFETLTVSAAHAAIAHALTGLLKLALTDEPT